MSTKVNPPIESLQKLKSTLLPHQKVLMSHPLYTSISTQEETRLFMQNHIFAVWDFMSLVKTLQNFFTCTTIPWKPKPDAKLAHFLNEIVLGEECDDLGSGDANTAISHYELYVSAMKEIGAETAPIEYFIGKLQKGMKWKDALKKTKELYSNSSLAPFTFEFVNKTITLCETSEAHVVASAFLFGREDPIPKMFTNILSNLEKKQLFCPNLKLYLERHIEVDGGSHSILGEKLIIDVCGDSDKKWKDAEEVAIESISNRVKLWDGVLEEIKEKLHTKVTL